MSIKSLKAAVTFAVQVRAMCGDKDAMAALRVDFVRYTLTIAVKGNDTQWLDGAREASGMKGTVAAAMKAGFLAVGAVPVLIKPQDAKNMTPEERAAKVEAEVDRRMALFIDAYDAAMPAAPTDAQKQAKKAEKDAKKAAEIAAAADAEIKARGMVTPDAILSEADMLAIVVAAIKAGKFGPAVLDDVRTMLGFDEATAAARQAGYLDGKAAAESLALDAVVSVPAAIVPAAPRAARSKKPAAVPAALIGADVGPMPAHA